MSGRVGCGAEGPLVSAPCIRLSHDDGKHDDGKGTRWTDPPCETCGEVGNRTLGCEECAERRHEIEPADDDSEDEPRIIPPDEARYFLGGALSCWERPWEVAGLGADGDYWTRADTGQSVASGMTEEVAALLAVAPDLAHTAAVLGEQQIAIRRYAEACAVTCKARGQDDRAWLDLLALLDRGMQ